MNLVMSIKNFLNDLLSLFFPRLCLACGKTLFDHEEFVCNPCWVGLARTHFHLDAENPVCLTFWGRVWLVEAAACFYYMKGNRVQKLIHQVKYKGEEELGVYLGEQYGHQLKVTGFLEDADVLLTVPLQPKKLKKRGYNQSDAIAVGLARALGKQVVTNQLYRTKFTETQTRKTRFKRWENVEHLFGVHRPEELRGKHVIVVDDVITTGSTIEACVEALQNIPEIKVSVLALAYSSR